MKKEYESPKVITYSEDEIIELTVKDGGSTSKLKLRKIRFYDRELKREFELI